jgi:hypothetical protein
LERSYAGHGVTPCSFSILRNIPHLLLELIDELQAWSRLPLTCSVNLGSGEKKPISVDIGLISGGQNRAMQRISE